MGKTALEKSHSKTSNAKLVMLCLLLSAGVTALWTGLALFHFGLVAYITLGAGAVLFIFSVLMIGRFTR